MTLAILKSRGMKGVISPERGGFKRDLNFFLCVLIAAGAMFVPHHAWQVRALFAAGLVGLYVIYVISTFRASAGLVENGHVTEAPEHLFIAQPRPPDDARHHRAAVLFGIALLVGGAGRGASSTASRACRRRWAFRRCCCR